MSRLPDIAAVLLEVAKDNNEVYRAGYLAGKNESKAVISRLCGAIEDYLDGVTEGNVAGLRQAVAAAEKAAT